MEDLFYQGLMRFIIIGDQILKYKFTKRNKVLIEQYQHPIIKVKTFLFIKDFLTNLIHR
jgi:hypothetical protein